MLHYDKHLVNNAHSLYKVAKMIIDHVLLNPVFLPVGHIHFEIYFSQTVKFQKLFTDFVELVKHDDIDENKGYISIEIGFVLPLPPYFDNFLGLAVVVRHTGVLIVVVVLAIVVVAMVVVVVVVVVGFGTAAAHGIENKMLF